MVCANVNIDYVFIIFLCLTNIKQVLLNVIFKTIESYDILVVGIYHKRSYFMEQYFNLEYLNTFLIAADTGKLNIHLFLSGIRIRLP